MNATAIIELALSAVTGIIRWASDLGHGDAVIAALQQHLTAMRAENDRLLREKHGR